ncbi:MAG: formate dehydrogenase [Peptococcaceae bacterium BICA1-7]|nr:MAG: formate dehydrogenase [Peptococcaceae bacterium BICA1-7]
MAGLATSFGSGAMTNSFSDLEQVELMFLIGTNTTEAHPVAGYKMRKAARRGAKLIVADPRRIELAEEADHWLRIQPGTDIPLLNGLMHIIIKEGLHNQSFIEERTENFEALRETVEKYTPDYVSRLTGVPVEDLYTVARLYATTDRAMLFYTLGITEHICGTNNVMSVANLAMLTGHLGRPGTGVNPIRGQNNVQGACDMGALPNVYTGYQKVTDPASRAKFEKAWGVPLPGEAGLMIPEMFEAAHHGELKAMYILGENPVLTDPDSNHIRAGLEKLEFLVVQELFMTETAEYADVVLPAASFAETDGTFTNTERRVQRVRQAIDPLPGMANWQSIMALGDRMGYPMNYRSAEEIFNEMASLTPSYAGISYARIEDKGLQWPCPSADHPGTPYLHASSFTRGKGLFQSIDHIPPAELPDREYPFLLSTGRILYHYNVTTPYSAGIQSIWSKEFAEVNPYDAERLGVESGDRVMVASRRGELTTRIGVTDRVPPGMIWMSFHYKDSPTNALTSNAVDPVTKTGEYKVCAVKMQKVAGE